MSIQRYKLIDNDVYGPSMVGVSDGDYVLYTDHEAELHNLLSTLADIRAALGVGDKPMLGELAAEAGRIKWERDEAVEALKELDDLSTSFFVHDERWQDAWNAARAVLAKIGGQNG